MNVGQDGARERVGDGKVSLLRRARAVDIRRGNGAGNGEEKKKEKGKMCPRCGRVHGCRHHRMRAQQLRHLQREESEKQLMYLPKPPPTVTPSSAYSSSSTYPVRRPLRMVRRPSYPFQHTHMRSSSEGGQQQQQQRHQHQHQHEKQQQENQRRHGNGHGSKFATLWR